MFKLFLCWAADHWSSQTCLKKRGQTLECEEPLEQPQIGTVFFSSHWVCLPPGILQNYLHLVWQSTNWHMTVTGRRNNRHFSIFLSAKWWYGSFLWPSLLVRMWRHTYKFSSVVLWHIMRCGIAPHTLHWAYCRYLQPLPLTNIHILLKYML